MLSSSLSLLLLFKQTAHLRNSPRPFDVGTASLSFTLRQDDNPLLLHVEVGGSAATPLRLPAALPLRILPAPDNLLPPVLMFARRTSPVPVEARLPARPRPVAVMVAVEATVPLVLRAPPLAATVLRHLELSAAALTIPVRILSFRRGIVMAIEWIMTGICAI